MKVSKAGRSHARLCVHSGRPPKTLIVVLAIGLAMGTTTGLFAADEQEIEYSVIAPMATKALALDATTIDDVSVAVGARGHILISTDAGEQWIQADVPTRATLTGVHFHDGMLGWAVGHDSVILKTTDGGTVWKRVYWAPEDEAPFFDVWFSDAENGFAIGAYGNFFVTSDGGESWDFKSISEDDWHLHQLARSASGQLYIAAEAGFIYRSDDNGATWTELPSPYEGSFFGVVPLDGDNVLLFGLRGHLFRSEDAGETWTELETGTVAMLTSGVVLSDGTILIGGLGGTVLLSTDGGRAFELHQQLNRRGIASVVDMGQGSVLLVGESGVRKMTVDELTAASD